MEEENTSEPIKVVFVGTESVGKTSILNRIENNTFHENLPPTVGGNSVHISEYFNGANVNLNIWDTAGQERYRSMLSMYYHGSAIACIIFSLTCKESFDDIKKWHEEISNNSIPPKILVIGNKIDLNDQRQVNYDYAKAYAKEIRAEYIEVSAKTGENMSELKDILLNVASKVKPKKKVTIEINDEPETKSCC
ncbi:Ras-related protein Rab-6.2 [Tritrichomonas foetus]|uniref:Ras-related protein Rab-6.2 n=1 Tax=Tritrichomonas foetus TaxID=1144522 RepID=A0A1J4J856_9EUKA|nr:Ras-related protein Rab-6.2 [Tritrichomonas foetus]|eukprot:OHS95378.1 Ras-related protein Rab-6.2 [Tritrichomonas foetus]